MTSNGLGLSPQELQHFKRQASRILTPASRKVLAKAIQSAGTQASSPLSIQVVGDRR